MKAVLEAQEGDVMNINFAICILQTYQKKPTLVNEIKTQEEAAWLDSSLGMAIDALKIINKINDVDNRLQEFKDGWITESNINKVGDS